MSRKIKWTYEKCKEEVLKFKDRNELKSKNKTLHNIIYENKWHELLENLDNLKLKNGYWNYDNCKKHALECKSKSEYAKKYNGGYKVVNENKWFELYSHMEIIGNLRKRLIYVYEFEDNTCYIGLTCNIKRRNKQHLKEDLNSEVFKHIKDSNLNPNLIIKSDYIKDVDAILLEEETLNKYKNNGWIILNKNKTGGLGSNIIKWNRDKCKDEINKYTKLLDFMLNSPGAYSACRRNNWLDLLDLLSKRTPRGFFNDKERCKKESLKYKNKTEFQKSWSAYYFSKKNNWIDEFFKKSES